MRDAPPIALLSAMLLAGCATPPPEPLHAPPPPAAEATNRIEAVTRPLPTEWWTAFRDPELNRLIGLAHTQNRDLQQAAARLEAAQARAKLAGAESALQVSGSVGATRQRSSQNTAVQFGKNYLTQFSAGLEFAYEADLWGRIRATRAAVGKEVELSAAERAAAEITLLAQVAKQHLGRLAVQREITVVVKQIAMDADTENLQATRVEAGFASELDLQRVRIEKATREGELAQLRESEQALANALAVLCGEAPGATVTNGVPGDAVLPEVPLALSLALLDARPDVAARHAKWEASFQRVEAARAEFYPALRLSGEFGYASKRTGNLLDWQSRLWSLVGGLTSPVLDGGRLKGNLALMNAQLREDAAGYEAAVLTAYREVADALNTLHALADEQAAAERVRDAAQRALALSRERYEKGFVTYLEVVESDRALLSAQVTLLRFQAGRQNATVDLIRALGLP